MFDSYAADTDTSQPAQVHLVSPGHIQYWSRALDASAEELRRAVREVGGSVADVRLAIERARREAVAAAAARRPRLAASVRWL